MQDLSKLFLSDHAKQRQAEFGLTTQELRAMLAEPQSIFPSRKDKMAICGQFAVVFNRNTIITILPRRHDSWSHA